eukprot:scaffold8595_cov134-Cylindrotheca_fusiformis.AAC.1
MDASQYDFNPKHLLWASITKTNVKQNAGLHVTKKEDGHIWVDRVDGAFEMFTQVQPGDRLLKIQEKDVASYTLEEIENIIRTSMRVEIEVYQPRPYDGDQSDATSVMTVEIVPGDIVTLQNMTATPELNGKLVKIKRQSTKEGRWLVEVGSTGEKMIADEKNLKMPANNAEVKEMLRQWNKLH